MTMTNLNQNTPVWQGFVGSSIGKSHIDSGLPNQDSLFFHQDSQFCVAVVCDGAGSARLSEQGSQFFAQGVGQLLKQWATEYGNSLATADYLSLSKNGLANLRQQLASQLTANVTLREYHTTVTAVLVLPTLNKALLIQVGDSPVLTSQFVMRNNQIDYFEQIQLFGDDSKNEYVNETHFITQDNWQDFLRIQWLDVANVDLIALMSDGCGDLVLQGGSQTPTIYRPFFGNLLFNLCQSQSSSQTTEQGNSIIEQAIANPATYRLTGDDKTLITLIKNPKSYQGIEPILVNDAHLQHVKNPPTKSDSVWHTSDESADKTLQHQRVSNNVSNNVSSHVDNNLSQHQIQTVPFSTIQQTTQPTATPLPPSQTLSQTGRERRNVAILAGTAVAIGAGVLGWVNKDRILPNPVETAQTVQPTPASTASTAVPMNQQAMLNAVAFDKPITFELSQSDLTDTQTLTLPFVIAINDVAHTVIYQGTPTHQATRIEIQNAQQSNIASATSTASSTAINKQKSTLTQPILTQPTVVCYHFADKKLSITPDALAKIGLSSNSFQQHLYCLVEFDKTAIEQLKHPLTNSTNSTYRLTLLNGMADLLTIEPIQTTPTNSSTAQTQNTKTQNSRTQAAVNQHEVQVVALPNEAKKLFVINPKENQAAASTPVSTPISTSATKK